MQLYEKHRPRTLSSVIGQNETVQSLLAQVASNALDGAAVMLLGPIGTGKTSIALALCADLGIDAMDIEQIGGDKCTIDFVNSTIESFALSCWSGKTWKALIVDEAHCMSAQARNAFLPYLEQLARGYPKNRIVIFTSSEIETDLYGNVQGPFEALASRCKVFSLALDVEAAARHVARIAGDENLNGQPIEAYKSLVTECQGNLRACLQRVGNGEMLRPFVPSRVIDRIAASAPAGSTLAKVAAQVAAIPVPKQPAARVSGASGDVEARIAAEIAFGAKFLPGSPKFKAHKARLAALESERAK
ncbi:MAG TPA: AAA family ATPase [Planctomycetota bacterium]|nr:AAA family ATPase [Planctomycetota bacterium]